MSAFIDNYDNKDVPHAFIQWKGTDVCMDFRCDCGENFHVDGFHYYTVTCDSCGTKWEMPVYVKPRKVVDAAS